MKRPDNGKGDGDHGLGNHPVALLNIAARQGGASINHGNRSAADECPHR